MLVPQAMPECRSLTLQHHMLSPIQVLGEPTPQIMSCNSILKMSFTPFLAEDPAVRAAAEGVHPEASRQLP